MDIITLGVLTFLIGFCASFIGSMVGGGGLLSIPLLIILGLPPQVAIATNKFGSLGLSAGAFIKYFKEKKIQWNYIIPLTAIGIVSAFIGANILVSLKNDYLSKITGIIILILLPIIVFNKQIGIKKTEPTKTKKIFGFVIYFFAMIWGAFFGGGGGTLVFYTFMAFFGFTIIQASATNKIPWFVMGIISVIIFALNNIINFIVGIFLMLGMFVGGYTGAHTAIKKGDKWVKRVFAIVVIASAIKLLFF